MISVFLYYGQRTWLDYFRFEPRNREFGRGNSDTLIPVIAAPQLLFGDLGRSGVTTINFFFFFFLSIGLYLRFVFIRSYLQLNINFTDQIGSLMHMRYLAIEPLQLNKSD